MARHTGRMPWVGLDGDDAGLLRGGQAVPGISVILDEAGSFADGAKLLGVGDGGGDAHDVVLCAVARDVGSDRTVDLNHAQGLDGYGFGFPLWVAGWQVYCDGCILH